jgi:hypothetical protein
MRRRVTAQALAALGVCAAIGVCTVYVTKSTAQSTMEGQPQAGDKLPRSMALQSRPDIVTGA